MLRCQKWMKTHVRCYTLSATFLQPTRWQSDHSVPLANRNCTFRGIHCTSLVCAVHTKRQSWHNESHTGCRIRRGGKECTLQRSLIRPYVLRYGLLQKLRVRISSAKHERGEPKRTSGISTSLATQPKHPMQLEGMYPTVTLMYEASNCILC